MTHLSVLTPAYLSAKAAAAFLGMSASHFRSHVAPEVECLDLAPAGARKRMPRWSVADLNRWAKSRAAA
jgi:hypothetical protein